MTNAQRDFLAEAVRNNRYVKLGAVDKAKHSDKFTKSKRNKLIQEWETNTGQKWPTYMAINKKTGELEAKEYQAHHIIPQQHGGPHEWWNMHPLKGGKDHQGGVHGAGSVLRKMIEEAKQ